MCASVFPLTYKNIEGVFGRNVSSDTLYKTCLETHGCYRGRFGQRPLEKGGKF